LTDRLAVVLRSRGYDVISAHEVEMRGKTDIEQLVYATNNKRVILTQNVKHFIDLQREYFKKRLKALWHTGDQYSAF
jgi:predicted nuclease of predicted toxin-antitoxin system